MGVQAPPTLVVQVAEALMKCAIAALRDEV